MNHTQNQYFKGHFWENYVARKLEDRGLEILDRNYRIRGSEIDIVALRGECIYFIEVKFRHSFYKSPTPNLGDIEACFPLSKQEALRRGMLQYLQQHTELQNKSARCDLALVCGQQPSDAQIFYFDDIMKIF